MAPPRLRLNRRETDDVSAVHKRTERRTESATTPPNHARPHLSGPASGTGKALGGAATFGTVPERKRARLSPCDASGGIEAELYELLSHAASMSVDEKKWAPGRSRERMRHLSGGVVLKGERTSRAA